MPPLNPYWVTITTGPGRTADRRILAPDLYAASWLYQQLYPEAHVLMVRRIKGGGAPVG